MFANIETKDKDPSFQVEMFDSPQKAERKTKKRSPLAELSDSGQERIWMNELKPALLAEEMIKCLLIDIGYVDPEGIEENLLGYSDKTRDYKKLDSLIWVFDLNPDGSELSFNWACDLTDHDTERMKRIIAKNMRSELKQCLVILASMISFEYAKNSEFELAEYVNLSGWDSH
jgi:hypothetical protein